MSKYFYLILIIGCSYFSFGQEELNYPIVKYGPSTIKANWITHPGIAGGEDVAILFRNQFNVEDTSEDFIINISADNHYYLYVNEKLVTHGPQLSDIQHWKYETLNLKKFLIKGENTMAIKVLNYGKRRFLGMQSIFTSLMVNGYTKNASIVTTKGKGDNWKSHIDPSYKAIEVNWREEGEKTIIGGFYANNPTDFVDINNYPTGWKQASFDDSSWEKPIFFEGASSMGGSIAYLLEPRNLPLLTWEKEETQGTIVRASGIENRSFPDKNPLKIGPNSKVSFLMDWYSVTNGYPTLEFSKGKNAIIKIKYAENLFGENMSKGDRSKIEGKKLIGYYDIVVSNGKQQQKFTPNWMRTFRFVQFEIETSTEALELNNYVNHRSRTAIPSVAEFTSDNEMYNQIFEICKRTVDICTQDYFLSDAYYETMQYVGDTKVHALLWQVLSGNMAHTKNALIQFDQSRDADGNILGAYPLRSVFIFPTYSLSWVDQIANYYRLTNDIELLKKLKPGILHTLYGFEKNMAPNHLVDKTPYRYFVDWYQGPNEGGGTATKNKGLHSAVVSLHFVYALQNASNLMQALGDTIHAKEFMDRANEIKKAVFELCYDRDRNIFAERPDKTVFDQHTNIMAILTNVVPEIQQKELLKSILEEKDLLTATYYYRYYLFKAIKKIDAPGYFDLAQKPWELLVNQNMTTTLERFESDSRPTRSEVHPWSTAPAYFYFDYLAGITSVEDNFKKISVNPRFGVLNKMDGVLPTPHGNISFNMEKSKRKITAKITLPLGTLGEFVWQDFKYALNAGENSFKVPL